MRKCDLIEYFSDKINKVNLIKINLNNLKETLRIQKEINCKDYEELKKLYDSSFKASNSLVEAIQNTIRRFNLNINFLVISYEN